MAFSCPQEASSGSLTGCRMLRGSSDSDQDADSNDDTFLHPRTLWTDQSPCSDDEVDDSAVAQWLAGLPVPLPLCLRHICSTLQEHPLVDARTPEDFSNVSQEPSSPVPTDVPADRTDAIVSALPTVSQEWKSPVSAENMCVKLPLDGHGTESDRIRDNGNISAGCLPFSDAWDDVFAKNTTVVLVADVAVLGKTDQDRNEVCAGPRRGLEILVTQGVALMRLVKEDFQRVADACAECERYFVATAQPAESAPKGPSVGQPDDGAHLFAIVAEFLVAFRAVWDEVHRDDRWSRHLPMRTSQRRDSRVPLSARSPRRTLR